METWRYDLTKMVMSLPSHNLQTFETVGVFSTALHWVRSEAERFPGFEFLSLCTCHLLPRPRHPGRMFTFLMCAHKSCYGSSIFVSEMNCHITGMGLLERRGSFSEANTQHVNTLLGTTWPQPPLCSFTHLVTGNASFFPSLLALLNSLFSPSWRCSP